jgi:hypothetical protein
MHDALGAGYTLLVPAPRDVDTAALETAMQRFGAPLRTLRLNEPQWEPAYRHRLVLVRPDLHVAWSGDALPRDAQGLAARVTGHGPAAPGAPA